MTRITTILAICSCVGLLFAPAAVVGDPTGPPNGLDVNVVNTPLPVTGDVSANVTGDVNVTNTPGVKIMNDSSEPVPVTLLSGGATAMRFVGVTEAETSGEGGGLIAMNRMCAEEYTGARMCTSHEIFVSNLTASLGTNAWINPSVASVVIFRREDDGITRYDHTLWTPDGQSIQYSTTSITYTFTCEQWTDDDSPDHGVVILEDGTLEARSCDPRSIHRVACCGPMQP